MKPLFYLFNCFLVCSINIFIVLWMLPGISASQPSPDSLPVYTSLELTPVLNSSRTMKTNGVVTEYSTPIALGVLAGFKLGYRVNENWSAEIGIEAGVQQNSLSFNLPAEKYNLPSGSNSKHRFVGVYLAVPLDVCYSRKLNDKYVLFGSLGVDHNTLLELSSGSTSYGIIDSNSGKDYEILEINGSVKPAYYTGFST